MLKFQSISEPNDADRERLVFIAESDTDLGRYAVFSARKAHDGLPLAGDVPDVYWFNWKEIKKGDYVVLYSKKGTASEKPNTGGGNSYFFYWGKPAAMWTGGRTPLLVSTDDWQPAPTGPEADEPIA